MLWLSCCAIYRVVRRIVRALLFIKLCVSSSFHRCGTLACATHYVQIPIAPASSVVSSAHIFDNQMPQKFERKKNLCARLTSRKSYVKRSLPVCTFLSVGEHEDPMKTGNVTGNVWFDKIDWSPNKLSPYLPSFHPLSITSN